MKKEIDNISTAQAKSICLLVLRMDASIVANMTEVKMRTEARKYLRTVKKTPAQALSASVEQYARKPKPQLK